MGQKNAKYVIFLQFFIIIFGHVKNYVYNCSPKTINLKTS